MNTLPTFNDSELSTIAFALQQYSFWLSEHEPRGGVSTADYNAWTILRRETWDLRDRISAYFKAQPSSAQTE